MVESYVLAFTDKSYECENFAFIRSVVTSSYFLDIELQTRSLYIKAVIRIPHNLIQSRHGKKQCQMHLFKEMEYFSEVLKSSRHVRAIISKNSKVTTVVKRSA